MKALFALLLVALTVSATAQTADALYKQACGPKEARFDVELAPGQPPTTPEPGKALVYFIQKQSGQTFTTRVGVDGSWTGVIQSDSYIFVNVAPGEHHACAATQNRKHLEAELLHFNAEAGKVYYYLVRGISADKGNGVSAAMIFGPADHDEALLLIASNLKSVATPKK
jgi:hypothetical protein